MRRALVLLAVVAVAHYGYHWLPDAVDRRWLFYVARGAEGVVLAALVVAPRPWPTPIARTVGAFAACLALVEEAQTSVCGAAEWGAVLSSDDLCMSLLGGHAFAALAAAFVALLLQVAGRNDA